MAKCGDECGAVSKCDIFDFMARHVGLSVIHPGGYAATDELLKTLHVEQSSEVIDIACGKGTSALYIAEKYGCKVTGIDISEQLVEEAGRRARAKGLSKRVKFIVGDAQKLPFGDGVFSVAVSQAMLVLVDDKVKAIREAARVIRKGGNAGWLELTWRNEPSEEFIEHVSDVLCSYCMKRAETGTGWEKTFRKAGVRNLKFNSYAFKNNGMIAMLKDEGLANSIRVFSRYLTNGEVRRRMSLIDRTFAEYPQYFGYGVYAFTKN